MRNLSIVCLFVFLGACSFHAGDNATSDDDGMPDASSDGTGTIDTGPDAPRVIVLSETTSDVPKIGKSVFCHNGSGMTHDNGWYRGFAMTDFPEVSGTFHVSAVHFASEATLNATPTATVYSYTGAIGGSTLDPAMMTPIATLVAPVPDSATPQALTFAMTADITAGTSFVVGVAATDIENGQGIPISEFHLAGNDAGQTKPSFYSSSACGIAQPAAQGGSDFIISVEGTY